MKHLHQAVLATLLGLSTLAITSPVFAQQQQQQPAGAMQAAMSDGEIKKVDKHAGKLTIMHGELKNLGMPGMTMLFKVKEPSMLDKVKKGDKVRFVAEKTGGAFTVTAIETVSKLNEES